MAELRSHIIMGGDDAPFYRSLFKSMGYTDYELDDKPIIGIANTWNTVVPGHFNLNQVSEFVKKGVYSAGGTVVALTFSLTLAVCPNCAIANENNSGGGNFSN